jgi:hypothetical protein
MIAATSAPDAGQVVIATAAQRRLRIRTRHLLAAGIGTLLSLQAAGVAAAADPQAVTISPPSDIRGFQSATNRLGDASVVWSTARSESDAPSVILSARRISAGAWSASEAVFQAEGYPSRYLDDFRFAMDQAGNSSLVYLVKEPTKTDLVALFASADGSVRTSVTLRSLPPDTYVALTDVEFDDAGIAYLVWEESSGSYANSQSSLMFSARAPGGDWQAPTAIYTATPPEGVSQSTMAVDGRGRAALLWSEGPGGSDARYMRGAFFRESRTWSPPTTLGALAFRADLGLSAVKFDSVGTAYAVWNAPGGLGSSVNRPDGMWEPTTTVPESSRFDGLFPVLAVSGREAITVWREGPSLPWPVRTTSRSAATPWARPRLLAADTYGSGFDLPVVAGDQAGNALIVFHDRARGLLSSFRPAGKPWRSPVLLPGDPAAQFIEFDKSPRATMVWTEGSGGQRLLRSMTIDPSWMGPPRVKLKVRVSRPARARAMQVKCQIDAAGACTVTASVGTDTARRLKLTGDAVDGGVVIGTATVAIPQAGATRTARVKLSSATATAIRRSSRPVRVKLRIVASAKSRTPTTLTRTVTLRG